MASMQPIDLESGGAPAAPASSDGKAIAVDGPAASGKSTVGKLLADRLGYLYFDTGLMYRAVAWLALERGAPITDEAAVTALAEAAHIDVAPPTVSDGRQNTVLVNGQDVTWALREPAVNANVSLVAAYGGVRHAMVLQQRRVGQRGQVVMVGRDIGTVVLPEAGLKIFLAASPEERARRRWLEEQARGGRRTLEQVVAEIRMRDEIDSTRAISPLRPAEDAVTIDSTGLTPEEVVEEILRIAGVST